MLEWMDFSFTVILAIVGLYFGYSFSRQQRLKIADQRLAAYRELWDLMEVARLHRIQDKKYPLEKAGALTREEARSLYENMTHWYFGGGNGMLIPDETKGVYLKSTERLAKFAVGNDDDWTGEGKRRMRDLWLLQMQMMVDLRIYGMHYPDEMCSKDWEFFEEAGVDPRGWPGPRWKRRIARIPGLGRSPAA